MKPYRVDVFFITGKHEKSYFDTIGEAVGYAEKWQACDANVFLLEHVFEGHYDIMYQPF